MNHRTMNPNLRKPILLGALLCAAAALGLTGCSTPSTVNTGTIRARTFSFVPNSATPAPGFADNRQKIHGMIQTAITEDLGRDGLTRLETGGDLTVGYLVIVGNNASTTAVDDYFGHYDDRNALQDRAHSAYTGGNTPYYYEAGTLVIDVRDSRTYRLLFRNHATRPLLRDIPDDARADRIEEIVREVLKNLKVSN